MSFATILVHTDLGFSADDRVRFAARLARACGAHLVGGALATPAPHPAPASAVRERLPWHDATMALRRFAGIARDEGVASSETCIVDGARDGPMALQSRHADLLVVGQPDGTLCRPPAPADLPVRLALHGGRPVLAMPCAGWRDPPDGAAVVAWDGSLEATHAIAAALPLLRLARRVTVVGRASMPDPMDWLARHGIVARSRPIGLVGEAGAASLAEAQDSGAGLLVLGAGAATGAVLARMTLPVLLAH